MAGSSEQVSRSQAAFGTNFTVTEAIRNFILDFHKKTAKNYENYQRLYKKAV
jgi:hypothetical protein